MPNVKRSDNKSIFNNNSRYANNNISRSESGEMDILAK